MLANKLSKIIEIDRLKNVSYQLITHFFTENINVSNAGITILALLAIGGKQPLKEFCRNIHTKGIYSSEQSVRNILDDFEDMNLIIKEGKKSKQIGINPNIKLITEGNILLDFKILTRESS